MFRLKCALLRSYLVLAIRAYKAAVNFQQSAIAEGESLISSLNELSWQSCKFIPNVN